MINILIIALVFGYGGYTLFRHIKKGSKGKCGACDLKESCSKETCE
ncbi:FeoB-associated Cys-rich membrane protein [Lentibacillus cibarius]|nr:FeoB-associated Cys-rich membrane protein [Lentibacillus cibarius]TRM11589.1 FeoB-associated Cys-rich membrane protein [Lentibacillus cibarius]